MGVEEGLEGYETLLEILGRVPVVCACRCFAVVDPAAEKALHGVDGLADGIVGGVDDVVEEELGDKAEEFGEEDGGDDGGIGGHGGGWNL